MPDQRRVLITGGATGIGHAMARAFEDAGDRIAICDTDAAQVASFQSAHPNALGCVADVSDEAAMDALFDTIIKAWGGVDVVCANAGTGGPAAPVDEIELEDWRACVAVNLDGAFLTARCAARVMRKQGRGVILMTASTSGLFGYPLRTPYVAAKWGVVGLTKALASELGPAGIRVNAICPGAVEGPRMDRVVAMEAAASGRAPDDVRAGFTDGAALRRFVTAEEVAATAVFLASEAASAITGQALAVDGHTERVT